MIHDHTPAKRINLISNVRRDPLDEGAAGFKAGAAAGGCCSPLALPFLRVAMCAPFSIVRSLLALFLSGRLSFLLANLLVGLSHFPAECALFASSVRPERKRKKPTEQIPSVPPTTNGNVHNA